MVPPTRPSPDPTAKELPAQLSQEIDRLPESLRGTTAAACHDLLTAMPASLAPPVLASIPRVIACSDFIAGELRRHPQQLPELAKELEQPRDLALLRAELLETCAAATDEPALCKALRQLRAREWLRLAWRDLGGWADLAEVVATLSVFADAALQGALDWWYQALCRRYGVPRSAATGEPVAMTVLALGKLGAEELNFSSDIDLMFCYEHEGQSDGRRCRENQEFFVQLGQKLIATLGQRTADGQVFRVDMRLRPFGNDGPLAASHAALESYYQSHGRDWERYALIKARPVAGDIPAGEALLETLRPFVFRRYIDYGAIDALREMKALITAQQARLGNVLDVKLGAGGIRDVEFFGQLYQLMRGGRLPPLRQRGILTVLQELRKLELVPAEVTLALSEAYTWLRNTEHRLQMRADEQTQRLPDDPRAQAQVALGMGFTDYGAFLDALRAQMVVVHGHFAGLLQRGEQTSSETTPLAAVWREELDEPAAVALLEQAGFADPQESLRMLRELRTGSRARRATPVARQRLEQVMPMLLQDAATQGLANNPETLPRLVLLVENIIHRSAYLALLSESREARGQLLKLLGKSPWVAELITAHPALLDELLDPRLLYALPDAEELEAQLANRLATPGQTPEAGMEQAMDALREVHHAAMLRIACAQILGAAGPQTVGQSLTWLAQAVLRHTLRIAWQDLTARYGIPGGGEPLLVGYGKLGSAELGYASDLDLVMLYQQGAQETHADSLPASAFYARLLQRCVHLLTTLTTNGRLYDIDLRLRPSGNAGPLAVDIAGFGDYLAKHAWTWERQALVRARPVAGSDELAERFEQIRANTLRHALQPGRDLATLRQEIVAMRQRIAENKGDPDEPGMAVRPQDPDQAKYQTGGLVDIEFIAQYLVLAHAADSPALLEPRATSEILRCAASLGLLPADQAEAAAARYQRLLAHSRLATLLGATNVDEPPAQERDSGRAAVLALWQQLLTPGQPPAD